MRNMICAVYVGMEHRTVETEDVGTDKQRHRAHGAKDRAAEWRMPAGVETGSSNREQIQCVHSR